MENLTHSSTARANRSFPERVLHLFVISYVYLFIFTSQMSPLSSLYKSIVLWLCQNIFQNKNIEYVRITGSGDTALDYQVVLVNIVFAFLAAAIILAADRKKRSFEDLHWFTVVVARYYIAMVMLSYGFAKLNAGQFPANSIGRLEEKVGDMSPMGILWTMMGASKGYTVVSGALETLGGLLLLFRRTKTMGAIFSMIVMINVALLNFFYDVPVKIFSVHIVFLCIFILTGDVKALYRFFILHQPSQLRYKKRTSDKKWKRNTLTALKCLVVVFMLFTSAKALIMSDAKTPMEGAYSITRINGNLPQRNSATWEKILIYRPGETQIVCENDSIIKYKSNLDVKRKTLTLLNPDGKTVHAKFIYNGQKDTVTFAGQIAGDSTVIKTVKKTKQDYLLNSRGFHWINEYPFNR